MSSAPVVSPWIVFPLAAVALLVVAAHLLMLRELAPGKMPESRRQIRIAAGWVMMVTVPMLAFGFGYIAPSDRENFALVWMANIGLLGAIILFAMVDAINNIRLGRRHLRDLEAEFSEYLTEHEDGLQIAHEPGDRG